MQDSLKPPPYRDPNSRSAVDRYRARYEQFARSPQALGWRPATQEVRFAAFLAGFSVFEPASILDIGCGFGDLLTYLRARGWMGTYVGVDIVPEFVAEAHERFAGDPMASFVCEDFMERAETFRCDAAFASGLLNHKRKQSHMKHVEKLLQAMARAGQRYVAVDFLSHTSDRRRPDLYFHDPARLLRFGLTLTKRAQLDHSYMPYEFMLKLWFPDSVPIDFPVFPEGRDPHV
jgi:SAM-dependent methyltransferase